MRTHTISRIAGPLLLAVALVLLGTGSAAAGSDDARGSTKFRDLPYSETLDPSGATGDPGDPNACDSGPATASVWWRFQPKADGLVTIDTVGSNYDTVLSVWTSSPGQSARNFTFVACNDDFAGLQSQVSFNAERNTTYFIMVDPFAGGGPGNTLVLNAS